jgi:hypothetical protein
VKEEEEVRAKNQAMVEMLQGDALERKEQTNARLAALREKIRLKCSDEQAKRLNRAAAQLKTIKAAERNSPDSAAGFCAQVSRTMFVVSAHTSLIAKCHSLLHLFLSA